MDVHAAHPVIAPRTPDAVLNAVRSLEAAEGLDGIVAALQRVTGPLGRPPLKDLLAGSWLGHQLHPLLTDFPLGCWMSATLLDLFGGREARSAAQGLTAFGLAMAVPTAAAGLADWRGAGERDRRTGLAHATLNGLVFACYATSLGPRGRGRRARAACWSVGGGLIAWVSGYLGGHLSLVRRLGQTDPRFDTEIGSPAS
jgi:uncharacterized membrane protein